MADAHWAARLAAADGRVTLTFSSPVRTATLTPEGARRLAAKLLLLAESAENFSVGDRTKVSDLCRSGCGRTVALAGYCDACIHGGSNVSGA